MIKLAGLFLLGTAWVAIADTKAPAPPPNATAAVPPYRIPAPAAPMTDRECAVWNRERSFAQSVERHDKSAFFQHLHSEAVFVGGAPNAARGSEAVLAEWEPLIAGKEVILRWYPGSVQIAGKQKIALSHGPYWLEDPSPEATQRFLAGTFVSTWVEDPEGTWKVLYDGGTGGPRPVSKDDVARLIASLPKECPEATPAG